MDFLDKKWDELKSDDEKIFKDERERKLCEGIPGIILLILVMLEAYLSHFIAFAFRQQIDITKKFIPFSGFWKYFDNLSPQNISNILVIPLVAAIGFAIIALIAVAISRYFIKKINVSLPTLSPETKSLDSAIIWAKALKRHLRWSPRYSILAFVLAVFWIVGMTAIIILNFKDTANVFDQLMIGFSEILLYLITWGILNFFTGVPKYRWSSHFNDIITKIKEEKEKQSKFNKCIQLFLEEKYDEAINISKGLDENKSGDIAAIKIISAKLETDTTEQIRKAYNDLWKAKELGFVNDKIRQQINDSLDTITTIVMTLAREDILKAYTQIIAGKMDHIILYCGNHAAYGHPDAIVLEIFGFINTEISNNPNRYEAWLEDLKLAKRRGISEELQEMAETLITELEKHIRINKEYEKWEKQIAAKYTPTYSMDGSLSSWAEFSGWYDFRTGEPLYRVEGHIVNAKGEDVSAAWWE